MSEHSGESKGVCVQTAGCGWIENCWSWEDIVVRVIECVECVLRHFVEVGLVESAIAGALFRLGRGRFGLRQDRRQGNAARQTLTPYYNSMPSSSTLSANDKSRVRSVIPAPTKILAASLARIYFAYPDPSSWTYGGLQGALVLVADRTRGAHFLTLVDVSGTRGVIWEHEIYKGFDYNQDRPFFHSFASDVRANANLCYID